MFTRQHIFPLLRVLLIILALGGALDARAQDNGQLALAQPKSRQAYDELLAQAQAEAACGNVAQALIKSNEVIASLENNAATRADSILLIQAYGRSGQCFAQLGRLADALTALNHGTDIASNVGDKTQLARLNNNIFGIYYTRHDYKQCEAYLKTALDLFEQLNDNEGMRNVYNNMGLIAYESAQYDKALEYMQRAIEHTADDDQESLLSISTNMAEVYYKQKDFARAEMILRPYVSAHPDSISSQPRLQAVLNMALIKTKLGKRDEADALVRLLNKVVEDMPLPVAANSFRQLTDICLSAGDSVAGLRNLLRYEELSDSLRYLDDTQRLQQLMVYYDSQRLQQQNLMLEQEQEKQAIKFWLSLIIALVLAALLIALFLRHKSDRRKNQLIHDQQQRLLQYEHEENERKQRELSLKIDHKNRELTSYTIDMAATSELHAKLTSLINDAIDNRNDPTLADASLREALNLVAHYKDNVMKNDFKVYFDEVHPEFFNQLSSLFPHLSKSDLRLCAYLHLGMSTKEIATLTYKEVRSVESARNRLRKKLNLPPGSDIQDFLNTLVIN